MKPANDLTSRPSAGITAPVTIFLQSYHNNFLFCQSYLPFLSLHSQLSCEKKLNETTMDLLPMSFTQENRRGVKE
jgi:hypothetical protein